MLKRFFKVFILLLLMLLSKAIFLMAIVATENNLHIEVKGLLAFLLVDIFLLNIIHSKKLMCLEWVALIINVISEFSGNNLAIIVSNGILLIVSLYIIIKTYKYKPTWNNLTL